MFVDVVEISVEGGKGGDGCVSTRREKYVPRGGPDGGNGGDGGAVWLVADPSLTTLLDFRYRKVYRAGDGHPGRGQCRTGARGKDRVVPVPCGTAVHEVESQSLLRDLLEPEERLEVCRGGRGGKGNYEQRTAMNQTPMRAQKGRAGEKRTLRLELKLLADLGLIGQPNAGKSTLLAALTAARPRIAAYPFTTLVPNLGIVDLGDFRSCTLADIPGLVEGASRGRGLGLEFLRHVERTRALVYVVDAAAEPVSSTLELLHDELQRYGRRLDELPFIIVLSKLDLVGGGRSGELQREAETWASVHGGKDVTAVSAMTGQGMDELRHLLRRLHEESAPAA
jgi:GTP-binding protein